MTTGFFKFLELNRHFTMNMYSIEFVAVSLDWTALYCIHLHSLCHLQCYATVLLFQSCQKCCGPWSSVLDCVDLQMALPDLT